MTSDTRTNSASRRTNIQAKGKEFHQLPVNRPKVPVNTYMFDGQMAYEHSGNAPVYAPNSGERAWSDETGPMRDGWDTDGEMVRRAYTLHAEDDDFGQPGMAPAVARQELKDHRAIAFDVATGTRSPR
ncbi:MAG TPA: catalase [Pseudolabrys sp.]|nr:catalase [Pseudolabrys sp.]